MDQSTSPTRGRLAAIARNAMKERGLLQNSLTVGNDSATPAIARSRTCET